MDSKFNIQYLHSTNEAGESTISILITGAQNFDDKQGKKVMRKIKRIFGIEDEEAEKIEKEKEKAEKKDKPEKLPKLPKDTTHE